MLKKEPMLAFQKNSFNISTILNNIQPYNKIPFKKKYATEKYITIPVTSTSVATNGADDAAGSSFNFLRKIGNIEPMRLPHKTIPMSEKNIVAATSFQ
jgi:hypothetical protein